MQDKKMGKGGAAAGAPQYNIKNIQPISTARKIRINNSGSSKRQSSSGKQGSQ